jgi:hypothetical protein
VHLRQPSFSHGVTSFLWGFFLGVFVWIGSLAIGVAQPTAFILGLVSFCAIFLYVRSYGEDRPGDSY